MTIPNALGVLGLGPRLLQQDNHPTSLCNDLLTDGCGCCKVVPCRLCLEWELPDGDDADTDPDIDYGEALPNAEGTEWTGSAGGISFRAYIDVNYCTINVELDGVLVYSDSLLCVGEDYAGPGGTDSCRDFSDEVEYTSGYSDGIFRWTKKNLLELNPIAGIKATEYVTGTCTDYHCGTCSCIPEKLCATLVGSVEVLSCAEFLDFSGTYCPNSGKVSFAEWTGGVVCSQGSDSITVTIQLAKNEYTGECEVSGTAVGTLAGESVNLALGADEVADCRSTSGIWNFTVGYIDYTLTIQPQTCGICSGINSECCPDVILPETLYVDFDQIAPGPAPAPPPPGQIGDDCGCAAVTVPIYGGSLIGLGSDESQWESGLMGWPCAGPTGSPFSWQVTITCSANVWTMAIVWYENCIQAAKPGEPIFCAEYASTTNTQVSSACDPFELVFTDASPGDLFPSGICIGGLTPAEMMATVTV